jgi:hypothetical protein
VILAGRGLTNDEIADRLFLSGRHQLRDLIDQASAV